MEWVLECDISAFLLDKVSTCLLIHIFKERLNALYTRSCFLLAHGYCMLILQRFLLCPSSPEWNACQFVILHRILTGQVQMIDSSVHSCIIHDCRLSKTGCFTEPGISMDYGVENKGFEMPFHFYLPPGWIKRSLASYMVEQEYTSICRGSH